MKKKFLNSADKDLLADLHKLKDELQLLKEELRANRSEDHPDQDHLRAETSGSLSANSSQEQKKARA